VIYGGKIDGHYSEDIDEIRYYSTNHKIDHLVPPGDSASLQKQEDHDGVDQKAFHTSAWPCYLEILRVIAEGILSSERWHAA